MSRASILRTVAVAGAAATLLAACGGSPYAPSQAAPSTPTAASAAGSYGYGAPASPSGAAALDSDSGHGTAASASSAAAGTTSAYGAAAGSAAGSAAGNGTGWAPASAPASAASAAGSASASGAPLPAGGVKITIAPDTNSEVAITMRELLAGNVAQNDAVERTKAVSGAINLDASGKVLPRSELNLDLRTLKSDRSQRDNFIKSRYLDTAQFPMVEFKPTEVQGLGGTPPTSGQKTFQLIGDATIHGVTRPLTWNVTASFSQQGCQGQATAPFKLSDFGMNPPKAGPVIRVDDAGTLAVTFQAQALRSGA